MYSSVESKPQFNALPEHAQLELICGNSAVPQIPYERPTRRLRALFYGSPLWVESLMRSGRQFSVPLEVALSPLAPRFFETSCGALLG